ncbi:uncharacterized protein alms1 isoform X2 [Synchiropus splendidus]|uniref:uncharacterized protein alms1 isoform X2 n=1 Tax=Synchiropus splendidus TaxID=270530 RepID=UPI00237D9F66|nr:uncharacterized protein alms1 isoform X2 [Synchiropus splendidus]
MEREEEDTADVALPQREKSVHQVEDHSLGAMGALDLEALQLQFQDSNLSPALPLLQLPTTKHNLTEFSLFHHSAVEFAALRPYPDTSVASTQSDLPPHDHTTHSSVSLSQHPLAQTSVLSEISESSCSQFSLQDDGVDETLHSSGTNKLMVAPSGGRELQSPDRPNQSPTDEPYFLSKPVAADQLLDLLQKDVVVPSSSSSAVSSQKSLSAAFRETDTFKTTVDHSTTTRQGPSGEACASQGQASFPEVCNVSMGSRSTQPDDSTETLHRELIAETTKHSGPELLSHLPLQKSGDKFTPKPAATSTGHPRGLPWTGSVLTGAQRFQRAHDLWSPATQTGIDGSYLGFLPQSQSTPGVFKLPLRSAKPTEGKLSDIESHQEGSVESSSKVTPTAQRHEEEAPSTRVRSLPSLDYKQKVDAWREYHTSAEPSLVDSLALKGVLGTSPKRRSYDAVSASLDGILSQQQPPGMRESSSAGHSGASSPRRMDAADGLAVRDSTISSAQPSASPCGRSQSHSSLNTVVMSTQTEQQPELETRAADEARQQTSGPVEPSPSFNLDRFSDVSLDRDLMLSPSQDSYIHDEVKLATSVGASSVVSLEVDNYAPYWTSKPSTPAPHPRAPELNIEERIPLYLHNLGIDQSPSAILTPFAPRGPIREPEFSPTDLSTIKGSIGTPTRSAQPSEGDSPLKGEYSRASVVSADSSISVPFSLDSLGPALSAPEQPRVSLSSSTSRASRRLAAYFHAELEPQLSITESSQRLPKDSGEASGQNKLEPPFAQDAESINGDLNATLVGSSGLQTLEGPLASSVPTEVPMLKISKEPLESTRPSSAHTWSKSSEVRRQSSIGQESLSSSIQRGYPSNPDTFVSPQRDTVIQGEVSSLNISKATRRAEPEGCSAAPLDVPPPVAPSSLSAASSTSEVLSQQETEVTQDPQEDGRSSAVQVGSDRVGTSDASSQSSLTVKVGKLLQMETPSTLTTSTPSTTDLEDSRVRDWIKLKKSGQLSKLPELDQEDREQIEEIKRELLLKNPGMNEASSDSESRSTSSGGAVTEDRGSTSRLLSAHQPASVPRPNLEAQVQEIAAREGVALRRRRAEAHTSITSPPSSPSPPQSCTSEPLLLTELRTAALGSTEVEKSSVRGAGRGSVRGQPAAASHGSEEQLDASFAAGHQPEAEQTQAVIIPSTVPAAAHHDFIPLRPATSSVISPDEGVGLSSPPEWNQARHPSRSATGVQVRADLLQQVPHTSLETPAPPVLLPYKPQGSEELFFIPQTEADISSTSMESSHTGSNDAVPPHFSSDVLGHQDPGLDRGVTIRHAEGIYSKRQGAGMMAAAAHGGRSSQTTAFAAPQWSTERSQVKLQEAPRPTKDQGTSPIQFFRSAPAGTRPTVAVNQHSHQEQGASLDQLWSRFCEQWSAQESRPIRDREASLLDRMERLSRLIQDNRSWTGARRQQRGAGRGLRREAPEEDSRLSSSFSQGSSNSLSICPADRDESSTTVSTVDTARLLRAFGAHRVQQMRSSSSLNRLYTSISRQQGARERVLDSSSSSSILDLSHQRPPRTLAAKKTVRMVSRGIQAGHLEIVSNATRRHTRDVGTTFPSPPENIAPPQVDSSLCAEPDRPEPMTTGILKRRSRPSGPRGVTWFISAGELRSEERKENESSWRPGPSWFEPVRAGSSRREPLRQVQQNLEAEPNRPPGTTTGSEPVSLQESLQMRRPAFIVQSRERMVRLAMQAEERKLFDTMSRERDLLLQRTGERKGPERIPKPADVPATRRAVSRKEMIQRSKQIYESLPEVQRKKEEERRRAAYRSYRLNAQIYNKRITSRVLERRRSAWK